MKKSFIILIAIIFGILFLIGYKNYAFTFDDLHEGEIYKIEGAVESPQGTYTANAYYSMYGGGAGGTRAWVELTHNKESGLTKVIYVGELNSTFSMEWVDEDTLHIQNEAEEFPSDSRSIELKVAKEIYHDKGLACKSLLMKDQYEACYSKE